MTTHPATTMTMTTTMALALMGCLASIACNGPSNESGIASDAATSAPLPDAQVATVDAVGSATSRLASTHPGWKKAWCTGCHATSSVAGLHEGQAFEPPSCVACHGYNGAVHRDHAADPLAQCADCHSAGAKASDHLTQFVQPRDCTTCHVHPDSLEGL